ncbi:hypothetical protein MJ904_23475 [Massilia sp. MB5]|uniref:hypothetical protein n=1 Tax=Massilia sp. MB5 TaxID=2919578 RepID=UPI001F10FCDF|nr:hypothetical protein [Massilia sp. MB5]UMR29956.1 hypothetical protein MJ904_23475 [Massilia sp. MB5]
MKFPVLFAWLAIRVFIEWFRKPIDNQTASPDGTPFFIRVDQRCLGIAIKIADYDFPPIGQA